MTDFAASDLVAAAVARYGLDRLRDRMRGNPGLLAEVDVVNGGSGFGSAPAVAVTAPTGSGAVVTAVLTGGAISSFVVTNPGSLFRGPLAVTITPQNGASAKALLFADQELLKIANSVISRVASAAQRSVTWPLPGNWPSEDPVNPGALYRTVWPYNLLENALELFNWRTLSGSEQASPQQQRVAQMVEKFFDGVAAGEIPLVLGTDSDAADPFPVAARNRDGSSNVDGVPDQRNILDRFCGGGWDF